jgi:mannosyltransferase
VGVGTVLERTQVRGLRRARRYAGPVALEPAVLAAVALTVLAAFLRFWRIGHQGFWFDEGNTALLVHFSPGKMLGLIPQSESTPPLYYCVAWVWARIFGYTEAPLRSLSAVAGVLTVPVAFTCARILFTNRIAVVAAALVACNPLLIWYSQEARSYALLVLLTSVSLLAFAYAREEPTPRRVLAWVVAAGLAMATHYYAVLAVVPQAVWLLAQHRRERAVWVGVVVAAACGLGLVPLAFSQNGTGHANWIAPIALRWRLNQIVPVFTVGFQLPAQSLLEPVGCALAGAGLALLVVRGERHERWAGLGTALLAVGGFALNMLMIAFGTDDLIVRNVLALWLPTALTVAAGLGARRAGWLGLVLAAGLCGIGLTAAVSVAVNRDYERPDWRGVARVLGARPAPGVGERVILVQHYRDLLPLSLYVPGVKFLLPGQSAQVRELDVVSFTAPRVHLCWFGAACNLSGTDMQVRYHVGDFRPVSRRHIYQFTVLRMTSSRPVTVDATVVSQALHTTRLRDDELLVQR